MYVIAPYGLVDRSMHTLYVFFCFLLLLVVFFFFFFFFQAEDGIRDRDVTGVQTCALPISLGAELLVSERTGEGVVLDTTGRPVREWESPHLASIYAARGSEVVAVRSPYYIPQFAAEPDTASLIRVLDTLGRPVAGLAAIHVPPVPFLAQLVNAGAVALGPDGTVYFAPLVRDEIRKYGPGGALRWTAQRGLFRTEPDPEFLPPKGRDIGVRDALVNVALVLGPDGRLYALGSDDSGATKIGRAHV